MMSLLTVPVMIIFLSALCKTWSSEMQDRIDVGVAITSEKAPFTVLVFCNNNKYFCSGTIVHLQWVLTAAHCLYDMNGEFTEAQNTITVVAGADSINFTTADVEAGTVQIRQSQQVVVHDRYSWAENFVNDLVLIQTKEPFIVSKTVRVAIMYVSKSHDPKVQKRINEKILNTEDDTPFTASGYGFGKVLLFHDTDHDFYLKEQRYEVSKHCHCLEKIRSIKSPFNILKKRNIFVCEEPVANYAGLCRGDAGGPLNGELHLRAVATALLRFQNNTFCIPSMVHDECGSKNTLSVFTDLCYFTPWLHNYIPSFPLTDENCKINTLEQIY